MTSDRGSDDDPLDALVWLTPDTVRRIHDNILEPGNLPGEDGARPIESALARIEQRVHYGDLEIDVLRIGAAYAVTIARAHAFIDGNKRTALTAATTFLIVNGYQLVDVDQSELADLMEEVAGRQADERALYARLLPHLEHIEDDR